MEEKRRNIRMDIDVKIKLKQLKNGNETEFKEETVDVNLVNVSRGGIAFRSKEDLKLNTFYDVTLKLWNSEVFETVVEIIRMENYGEEETLYGARYIGMVPSDRLKIQIHEILLEQEKNGN